MSKIIDRSGKEGIKDGGKANGLLRDTRFYERYSLAGARSFIPSRGVAMTELDIIVDTDPLLHTAIRSVCMKHKKP